MMISLKKFFSKRNTIYFGLVIVFIVSIIIATKNGNGKNVATVNRADVIQEVVVAGKVKPNQDVDLGFDQSGRVAKVYAKVGDNVKTGQIIAELDSGEISANLNQSLAALQEEKINLRELQNTSPISYADALKNLSAAIKKSFADADNAVRNKTDQFFKYADTNPKFEVSFTDGNSTYYFKVANETALEINNQRKIVEKILDSWQIRISNLNSANLSSEANQALSDLNTISDFMDKIAAAINAFSPSEYAYESTVSGYKTDIANARTGVSGAISSVVDAKDKLTLAPTPGDNGGFENVSVQEAKVNQAAAVVSSLEAALSKTKIRAPFDGVVTLQEAKVGSAVNAGETLVSIISQNQMYIEANISEIHIGKLTEGNLAVVTFDAFPNEEFSGKISYIEPGDVLVDGVVNYKARIILDNFDQRIKSGLTANLKIQTAKKENVLVVPLYAVFEESNQNFVNKIVNNKNKTEKTPIEIGLVGRDGMVEILSGLGEGDSVSF